MAQNDTGLSRHIAWLLLGLIAGCLLFAGAAAILRPRTFETHDQAVGYVLEQHDIAYEQVRLARAWPDTMSRSTYGADVIVRLSGTQQVTGRLECRIERSQCYLYLRRLGIERQQVPDLSVTPAWLTHIQRSFSTLLSLARGLVDE